MNVTAVIPTYRNPEYLDLCLKSIRGNQVLEGTQVIIVVDGYPHESKDVLAKYPGINVISYESNMGMQHAINLGVWQSTNELVFIANDDNVFPKEWDKRLADSWDYAYNEQNRLGDNLNPFTVTANQIEPTPSTMFDFVTMDFGRTPNEFKYEEFLQYESSLNEIMINVQPLGGNIFPFMIEKKWFMVVGGFDTFYPSPQVCDWDFFLKLELLGSRPYKAVDVRLYHFGSKATKSGKEGESFRQRENIALSSYYYKWGIPPYNQPKTNSKIPPDGNFRGFHC